MNIAERPRLSAYNPVKMERAMGIEPTSNAWQALVLPLNHARKIGELIGELIPRKLPIFSVVVEVILRRKPRFSAHQFATGFPDSVGIFSEFEAWWLKND